MADMLTIRAVSCITIGATFVQKGKFSITPTDQNDQPIPVRAGALGPQLLAVAKTADISNGSIPVGALKFPNPAWSSPGNVRVRIDITDTTNPYKAETTTYRNVLITDDGTGQWDFATYNTGLATGSIPHTLVEGPPGPGFNPIGTYSGAVTYAKSDVVALDGQAYVSLQAANIAHTPGTAPTWWMLIAQQGPMGEVSLTQLAQLVASADTVSRGGNLFDKSTPLIDSVINWHDGSVVYGPGYAATGFIFVHNAGKVTTGTIAAFGFVDDGVAFYDAQRNYISGFNPGAPPITSITIPPEAYYMRFWWDYVDFAAEIAAAMVVPGDTLPDTYMAFTETNVFGPLDFSVKATPAQVSTAVTEDDTVTRSGNLFDKTVVVPAYAISTIDGSLVSTPGNYASTGFIYCHNAGQLTSNIGMNGYTNLGVAFYDANRAFLSSMNPGAPPIANVTVPPAAYYMRFWWAYTDLTAEANACMVVAGPTLPASYVAYKTTLNHGPIDFSAKASPTDVTIAVSLSETVLRGGNLFDKTAVVNPYAISTVDGSLVYSPGPYAATGFIYCHNAGLITSSIGMNGYTNLGVAFYDANKSFLSSMNPGAPPITSVVVPIGAYYMRFWWAFADLPTEKTAGMVVAGSTLPSSYVSYGQSPLQPATVLGSPWQGKKVCVLGDSITARSPWYNKLASDHGMTVGFVQGNSGATVYKIFDQQGYRNDVTGGALTTARAAVTAAIAGHDLIIIEYGTNDAHYLLNGTITLGAITDASTAQTFFGWWRWALDAVRSIVPTACVIVVSPYLVERIVGQTGTDSGDIPTYYTDDYLLNTYIPSLKTICAPFSAPVIDMARESGINRYNISHADGTPFVLQDHLHPTDPYGYEDFFVPAISHKLATFGR